MPVETMTTRDRFHAVMNFQPFDRLPILEWANWWKLTLQRWYGEGLPSDVQGYEAVCRHFGLDLYLQDWVAITRPGCPGPATHGGAIIADHDDYTRIKPFLYPRPAIDVARWQTWAQRQKRGEVVLWFTLEGFFWFARRLLGIEAHLYAYYDQAELLHRINEDLTRWMLDVIDDITAITTPDFMSFAEDMSYNHGPMLSPQQFDTFMLPYYQQVVPALRERGIFAMVDTDGDVTSAAAWFREAGLDGIMPLERQAGVDAAQLRRDHPGMRFLGHFDKLTMFAGHEAMVGEFNRLLPVARQGGTLVSCDHQTPPQVSYLEYQDYLSLFRDFAFEAARG